MERMIAIKTVVAMIFAAVIVAGYMVMSAPAQSALPSPVAAVYVSPISKEESDSPIYRAEVQWVEDVARRAGLTFPVTPEITDIGNCGTGCTSAILDKKTNTYYDVQWIKISPSVIGTTVGEHVVLHELAHAYGVVDECEADNFAHAHGSDHRIYGKNTCFKE